MYSITAVASLDDIIIYTIKNNHNVQQAVLNLRTSELGITLAQQQFSPQAKLTMSAQHVDEMHHGLYLKRNDFYITPGINIKNSYGGSISLQGGLKANQNNNYTHDKSYNLELKVEQPLLQNKQYTQENISLKNNYDSYNLRALELKNTIEEEILNAIITYLDTFNTQLQLQQAEKNYNNVKHTQDIIHKKIAYGVLPENDKLQAKFMLLQAEAQLESVKESYTLAKAKLERFSGQENVEYNLQQLQDYDKTVVDLEQKLQQHNALLQNNAREKQALDDELSFIKSQENWDLRLYARVNLGQTIYNDYDHSHYISQFSQLDKLINLVLSIPISPQHNLRHKALVNRVNYEKNRQQYIELCHLVQKQAQQFRSEYNYLHKQRALATLALKLARQNYNNGIDKLAAGHAAVTEIQFLQEKLYTSEIENIMLELQAYALYFRAMYATGGLYNEWQSVICRYYPEVCAA